MTIFPGAGSIEIRVSLAGEIICSVEIRSTRPVGLTRVFVGREPSHAPLLARQLFSLCGAAQAAAASQAVAWAQGRRVDSGEVFGHSLGVLTERVFEGLRGLALGWPDAEGGSAAQGRAAPHLRDAATAARGLIAASASGLGRARRQELLCSHARLTAAAQALGLASDPAAPPEAASYFAGLAQQCATETAFLLEAPDALNEEDDRDVVAALRRDPEAFAGAPRLAQRGVETGAHARLGRRDGSGLLPRLSARLADMALSLSALETALRSGEAAEAGAGGGAGTDAGYGVVESARGRLYHLAQITSRGRIGEYRIVAPTEWNFHANGPYVAAALGARLPRAQSGRLSLERLAALFDPCVGFEVSLKEFAGA